MTEQEIEQARAEVDQLDIAQLRCSVLFQLLYIEAIKKERDALAAAAKLALDALGAATTPLATDRQEVLRAIEALRDAGVQ
jgi:hypothetical protein